MEDKLINILQNFQNNKNYNELNAVDDISRLFNVVGKIKNKVPNDVKKRTIHSFRVRFYLCDFDEYFEAKMPCRINTGDSFYIDDFISKGDGKKLKKETIDYLYNDGSILECNSFIFGRDKQGIYQQCYLTERA